MNFEVILDDLYYESENPFHFLKYGYKYKISSRRVKDLGDQKSKIKFIKWGKQADKNYKNTKVSELPLDYFKIERIANRTLQINSKVLEQVRYTSGVIGESKIDQFVENLIPNSFVMRATFELQAPYFSRDDDDFYIIDNPIMKEKVWKVPMIRPSAWKGALFKAAIEKLKKQDSRDFADIYFKIYRIFGAGSDEFRKLSKWIEDKNEKKFREALMSYALFELGIKIHPKSDTVERLRNKILRDNGNMHLVPHKGRVIFYPTYFNRLSLEVINPHNRKTKAGTHPIYYEVVPKESKGIFQLIYIPYDVVLLPTTKARKQAEGDAKFLIELFKETLQEIGIGAKTKLGWGKAELENIVCKFQNGEDYPR